MSEINASTLSQLLAGIANQSVSRINVQGSIVTPSQISLRSNLTISGGSTGNITYNGVDSGGNFVLSMPAGENFHLENIAINGGYLGGGLYSVGGNTSIIGSRFNECAGISASQAGVYVRGSYTSLISNIFFNCNPPNGAATYILSPNSSEIVNVSLVDNMYYMKTDPHNAKTIVNSNAVYANLVKRLLIEGNQLNDITRIGIETQYCKQVQINKNKLKNIVSTGISAGDPCQAVDIKGNTIDTAVYYGIEFCSNLGTISDNILMNINGSGIQTNMNTHLSSYGEVVADILSNIITNTKTGIYMYCDTDGARVGIITAKNNFIKNVSQDGIFIDGNNVFITDAILIDNEVYSDIIDPNYRAYNLLRAVNPLVINNSHRGTGVSIILNRCSGALVEKNQRLGIDTNPMIQQAGSGSGQRFLSNRAIGKVCNIISNSVGGGSTCITDYDGVEHAGAVPAIGSNFNVVL